MAEQLPDQITSWMQLVYDLAQETVLLRLLLDKAYREPIRQERDALRDELQRYTASQVQ